MFKKLKESIVTKIEEQKELKAIEQAAYEEEKEKVDRQKLIDKKEAAREKGKAKANKSTTSFFDKLDKAAERMNEYNTKQKQDPVELVKIGSCTTDEIPIKLYRFGDK